MADNAPSAIATEEAFTARVQVGPPVVVDRAPTGVRRYIPILGGSVAGPVLRGKVLAAGGDSQLIRADGVIVVEAAYFIQSDDGVVISVLNRGLRQGPPEVMSRLMRGEHVAPGEYYFRTVAQFEAPTDSRYADLSKCLYIAIAEREPHTVIVHFHRLK